jgi:hypothetical protein
MGVWTTGPKSRRHSLESPELRAVFDRALPGWQPEDVAGSPFALSAYRVPPSLGDDEGLRRFRGKLHSLGLQLILDFIPNHVGLDHPWLRQHPEYFVQSRDPLPDTFELQTPAGPVWIAHGKDPNFPAWTDTAQLDFRRLDTQRAIARAFRSVAERCDGVRCDMAMLLLREVFASHWAAFAPPDPLAEGEFWSNLIRQLRRTEPAFLLLAEAYWNLEGQLQDLGFDYTYDKRLYDHLVARKPAAVRDHLLHASPAFVAASAHFLENHDEPPVAGLMPLPEHRAAALATLALPGLRLVHDGQLHGHQTHLPVHLGRRPETPADPDLATFYRDLLRALKAAITPSGRGEILMTDSAWPGNPSHETVLVIQWRARQDDFALAVVNLAPHRSQCYVTLAVPNLSNRNWRMTDLLGHEEYQRFGDDLQSQGLYLDVAPNAAQLFRFSPLD